MIKNVNANFSDCTKPICWMLAGEVQQGLLTDLYSQ